MSSFASLQYKSAKTTSPVRQRASVLRPSRGFEPLKVAPSSKAEAAPNLQMDAEHATRFSLAHIPVDLPKKNNTGLPDTLKSGIESLSGLSLDDVHIHYNSSKPAQFEALAYTQGTEIHMGPGQEKHLPHEAWHVVQQRQERVKPTMQMKGTAINDSDRLEHEADMMGAKANTLQLKAGNLENSQHQSGCGCASCTLGAKVAIQKKSNPAPNSSIAVRMGAPTNVIQRVKACQVCGHKHGSTKCTVKVNGEECGCTSHSSKWDSGSKFNPGSGKRKRMLEARRQQGQGN